MSEEIRMTNRRRGIALLGVAVLLGLAVPSLAQAAPVWSLQADANTYTEPGSNLNYYVQSTNVGDAPTSGEYRLRAEFPAGVTAEAVAGSSFNGVEWICSGDGPGGEVAGAAIVDCVNSDPTSPGLEQSATLLFVTQAASVEAGAVSASFEIAGGAALRSDGTACGQAPLFDAPPCALASKVSRITNAEPEFGIDAFDGQVIAGPGGTSFTQAGGHPYALSTQIDFNTWTDPLYGSLYPVEPTKTIVADLPPGLVGNPTSGEQCKLEQLAVDPTTGIDTPLCPAGSQLGIATVRVTGGTFPLPLIVKVPVYNMDPPPDAPARFGLNVFGAIVSLDAQLRSGGDYGLSVNIRGVSEAVAMYGTSITLWGFPADPRHDGERFCPGAAPPCSSNVPLRPFFRLPTSCTLPGQGLTTTVRADSWVDPGDFESKSVVSHLSPGYPSDPAEWGPPQGPTGCEDVGFDPSIDLRPTERSASSPTGLAVDLSIPQVDDPNTGLAPSDLKTAVVKLPSGMSVNPAAAAGLSACTTSQIGLIGTGFPAPNPIHFTKDPARCPDSSKIGTVTIETPLLDHAVNGSVYLAAQNDNPFKSFLAMYIVAEDSQSGVVIKLPGHVEAQADGRLITTFDNQPQLPFEKLHLELFDGPRAALRTPPTCGTKTTTAELTPWARPGSLVSVQSSFQVTSGPNGAPCAAPGFDPKLSAGSTNPLGGAKSPFVAHLSRNDGEQELAGLEVTNPPGFAAVLKGVPYCPEAALSGFPSPAGTGAAQLVTPSCPAASQIGTVDTGAGAGPLPFHVAGKAYLAGPYKGAPLSLAFFVPAIAGPFDLGTVMVRAAAHVDPQSAQVTVKSDPLPTILEGIPLDVRSVDVAIDHPGFALNPTSCDVMAVKARVTSVQGTVATPQSRYQLLGCGDLGFKPSLRMRLFGQAHRGAHPKLRAVLRMPKKNQANIARTAVTLPASAFLDQSHLNNICTRVRFAEDNCPKGSIYGYAAAKTPLLDEPLRGPVYLRSSNNKLPDLVAALQGQIDIELVGRIDSVKLGGGGTGIRTTFESVPDAPVSKFVLTMQGGKKGLIQNSTNLCAGTNRATVKMDGHNGKIRDFAPVVKAACGKHRKAHNQRSEKR